MHTTYSSGTADQLAADIKELEDYDANRKHVATLMTRNGYSKSGLPNFFGFFENKRPDAIILENWTLEDCKFEEPSAKQKAKIIVHLIEYTCTSEAYLDQAAINKHTQHEEIVTALSNKGWKVKLHIIIMGVRGWMPTNTWNELDILGIPPRRRAKLELHLSRLNIRRGVEIIWTRAKLETLMNKTPDTRQHLDDRIPHMAVGRQEFAKARRINRYLREQVCTLESTQRKKKRKREFIDTLT